MSTHLANTTKVGCPISTKKLTMTQEFLTTAEELYAALTEQQVNAISILKFSDKARHFYGTAMAIQMLRVAKKSESVIGIRIDGARCRQCTYAKIIFA